MRYDELRNHVHGLMRQALDRSIEALDAKGPYRDFNAIAWKNTRDFLADGADSYWEALGPEETEAKVKWVAATAGLSPEETQLHRDEILRLLHLGFQSVWEKLEGHRGALEGIELLTSPEAPKVPLGPISGALAANDRIDRGKTVTEAIDTYFEEQRRAENWGVGTRDKRATILDVLIELVGKDTPCSNLSKRTAQDVKEILLKLPKNKNKNSKTKDLNWREAAEVDGVPKMSITTVNDYIGVYSSFCHWAAGNGHMETNIFERMKVIRRKGTDDEDGRAAFSPEALATMFHELTRADSAIVKQDKYRWASLIGMFTGARLNEICSLRVADVVLKDGIMCFSINIDDPENLKRVKTSSGIRILPVHSQLIQAGFLQYVEARRVLGKDPALFDFPYFAKEGFGKYQGKWFNEVFLPKLGLKTPSHVFHSFRHTISTRLQQANVPVALVKAIVGHRQDDITSGTYFGEGFAIKQKEEALEKFHVKDEIESLRNATP